MATAAQSKSLLSFFDPSSNSSDPSGRTLAEILTWPDEYLEYSHDYIQNVFPLPEGSLFNSDIWLVTPEAYRAFRERSELRHSLELALERICRFYGLEIGRDIGDAALRVTRGQNFSEAKAVWLNRFSHNHLRITRILRSLRVLGLEDHCRAFHTFLTTDPEVKSKVSQRSTMYWTRAASRPLRLPPDEDNDKAEGIQWLAELER